MPLVKDLFLPSKKCETISKYREALKAVTGEEITQNQAIEKLLTVKHIERETKRIKKLL